MKAIEAFEFNIERAHNLVDLYDRLIKQGMQHSELDDLLRSSYVQAVGALDAFVHDRIGERLVQFVRKSLDSTSNVLDPIEKELKNVETREVLKWLTLSRPFVQVRKRIEEKLGYQSFQQPGKIEEAFLLIGKREIWKPVAAEMGVNVSDIKRKLIQVSERRNQIVHEGDREKSRLKKHQKRPIEEQDVIDLLDFIEKVGKGLVKI